MAKDNGKRTSGSALSRRGLSRRSFLRGGAAGAIASGLLPGGAGGAPARFRVAGRRHRLIPLNACLELRGHSRVSGWALDDG